MESRSMKIPCSRNKNITLSVIPGHFATNHSHINYYIDMTGIKYRSMIAKQAGETIAQFYEHNTSIDTIICMDGCEIIGGFLADALSKSSLHGMNEKSDICVITPEFHPNGQIIFRDNIQPMVWGKRVLLLVASATTGKTINRSLECIKYYGGNVVGIAALFSAITEKQGIRVDAIFTQDDIPNYRTYPFEECPDCCEKKKIDAIVNSYGYSKI